MGALALRAGGGGRTVKGVAHKPRATAAVVPVGVEELREIERGTVLLAELRAGAKGQTCEQVLGEVFSRAAASGRSPMEILKRMRVMGAEEQ